MQQMETTVVPWIIATAPSMYGPLRIVDVHWRSALGLLMSDLSQKATFPYLLKVGRDQEKVCQDQVMACLGRVKACLDRMTDGSTGYLVSKTKSKVGKEVRAGLRPGKSERC
jgi:hypothetical protein